MDLEWNDNQPIYRQLRDRVVAMILDGVLKDGDSLPSVRSVAAEYRVNPLTVLKGYQQLVDEGLVETRRGRDCEPAYFCVGAVLLVGSARAVGESRGLCCAAGGGGTDGVRGSDQCRPHGQERPCRFAA